MPKYLGALTIVLLLGMVLTRVLLLKRQGIKAMKFGSTDKTDFLFPPFVLFYAVLDQPDLSRCGRGADTPPGVARRRLSEGALRRGLRAVLPSRQKVSLSGIAACLRAPRAAARGRQA